LRAQLKPRIDLEGRTPLQDVVPLATPIVVFVDPASACNFRCTFCPTGHFELSEVRDRYNGLMKFDLFRKIVDDLAEFDDPIKVLRLYKDGEPFLNKRLADMVRYAKRSGHVVSVDTTTNGSLITPERIGPVLDAGIDKINVSVDGMTEETYRRVTGVKFDFTRFVDNLWWLYANRGQCEVVVKTIGDILTFEQRQDFFNTFGDHSDRIFIENLSPCWPEFDVVKYTGAELDGGLYQQGVATEVDVCPYIFYGYSVNADGLVSACFVDWGRKLIVGDAREQSMRSIWNSSAMNDLRLLHLEGRRKSNPACGSCGQLSHCHADNIDVHRLMLLDRVRSSVEVSA